MTYSAYFHKSNHDFWFFNLPSEQNNNHVSLAASTKLKSLNISKSVFWTIMWIQWLFYYCTENCNGTHWLQI